MAGKFKPIIDLRQVETQPDRYRGGSAFTLVELLVVIALIAVLAAMLLPVLSRAQARAQGFQSVSNTRQLTLAWFLYSDDNNGRLPYNLGGGNGPRSAAMKTNANWVNNNLTWELDADNTNTAGLTEASLSPYLNKVAQVYRCPADKVLSQVQREAGWSHRVRSYSMNAMVGDAGEISSTGKNQNNPSYTQFFRITDIPRPADIFIFVEEHPDSINDGYFLNKFYVTHWIDLPASEHNSAAPFAFADGHALMHPWQNKSTLQPQRPDAVEFPLRLSATDTADLNWVMDHTSRKTK